MSFQNKQCFKFFDLLLCSIHHFIYMWLLAGKSGIALVVYVKVNVKSDIFSSLPHVASLCFSILTHSHQPHLVCKIYVHFIRTKSKLWFSVHLSTHNTITSKYFAFSYLNTRQHILCLLDKYLRLHFWLNGKKKRFRIIEVFVLFRSKDRPFIRFLSNACNTAICHYVPASPNINNLQFNTYNSIQCNEIAAKHL